MSVIMTVMSQSLDLMPYYRSSIHSPHAHSHVYMYNVIATPATVATQTFTTPLDRRGDLKSDIV